MLWLLGTIVMLLLVGTILVVAAAPRTGQPRLNNAQAVRANGYGLIVLGCLIAIFVGGSLKMVIETPDDPRRGMMWLLLGIGWGLPMVALVVGCIFDVRRQAHAAAGFRAVLIALLAVMAWLIAFDGLNAIQSH
jgi:hypothetical protein